MTPLRNIVFAAVAYGALLGESALGHLLRRAHRFFTAPELGLLVVVYLGLCGRGSAIGLTCSALAIGYLRDLLVGAPRGMEAFAFALCALLARMLHGRVFVDRFGLAVVCTTMALLHGALLLLLAPGDSSARALLPIVVSALVCGPPVVASLRALDLRVAPEQRTLHVPSGASASWR